MRLSLDAPAVRALISDDEEMHLELSRSVISETIRNMLPRDTSKLLEIMVPELHKELHRYAKEEGEFRAIFTTQVGELLAKYQSDAKTKYVLTQAMKDRIAKAAEPLIDEGVKQINDTFRTHVNEAVQAAVNIMTERLDKRVTSLTDDAIKRTVDQRVNERLNAILAGLSATQGS